jgi:nucleoside-diphosphate-sugar epimerase
MKVLLIGGTRFVGYLLVWRLIAAGHQVSILNRGTRRDPFGSNVERLVADRRSPDFERLLAGRSFDAVVDLFAYQAEDVARSIALFEGRIGHYVFISTGQVYLVREGMRWPAREDDYSGALIPEPSSAIDQAEWAYGVKKREAEDLLLARPGFPSTRLRLPMVNGELDFFRRIESYLWRILDGGPVLLVGGGQQPTRHVYGADVAKAIASLLLVPGSFGQAYNLSQRETPTLEELVAKLAALLGAPARLEAVARERAIEAGLDPVQVSPFSDPWMSRLDASRAELELGFRHQTLERYLEAMVTSFLSHPPADRPPGYERRGLERGLRGR